MKITKFLIFAALLTTLSSSLVWSHDRAKPRSTPPLNFNEGSGPIAKPEECVYFTITLTNSHLLVYTSDAGKFLINPVGALRADGMVVPPPAEPHWLTLTVALRRLANPRFPPSSRSLSSHQGLGILKSQIARLELPGGSIPVVGDWNGDGTITSGDFMIDPIRSLRAQRVAVSAASEPALRQLVEALKALRGIYARPNTALTRQNSGQPELTAATPQTAAQRRRIIEGYSAEFYAGNRIESGRVVGSCNTPQGCLALKNACNTLNKHSFKTTRTSRIDGVCIDQTQQAATATWFLRNTNSIGATADGGNERTSNQQPAGKRRTHGAVTFTKEIDMSTPSLHCDGSVMCRKVKTICPAMGGTYTRINDVSGTCHH